jgi:hypothetical protein
MKIFFASGMIFFLVLLIFCQMYFYVKNKIKFNDSRGVLLFIDRIMFQSCWLNNLSSIFFFISSSMGLALSWVNGEPHERVISYCIGFLGVISLFLHCRLYYMKNNNADERSFLKELLLKCEFSRFSIFIWVSRLFYLTSFFMLFYYGF